MAGILLEFSQHGDFDSFSIIRSLTPIDINALPPPLVVGLQTMFFFDDTVVAGQTYYYRPVVWKGGEIFVGEEVSIKASTIRGYKKFRILISKNCGSFYLAINEIEMFLEGGNTDETNPIANSSKC